jgi:ligand-binding SRPBCC domain-containing protein
MLTGPVYRLTDAFSVPTVLEKTWDFFSTADNLGQITPAWMGFRVTTRGVISLQAGSQISYRIRVLGLPMRWRTLITAWSPPNGFEDLQLDGPYAQWHHVHEFEAASGGTICRDRVLYRLPGGLLGPIVHRLLVRRQLLEVFRFRREAIGRLLGPVTPLQADVEIVRI